MGQQLKGQQLMGQEQLMQQQRRQRQQLLLCLYCCDVFVGIQLRFQDTHTAVLLVKRLPKKYLFLKYLFMKYFWSLKL
jgi:hypothetical protein